MPYIGTDADLPIFASLQGDGTDDLQVKVVKLTDATIQLDWSLYTEPDDIGYYK